MSSRGKSEQCRICGGGLQGNQRRWLFGGQKRKNSSGTETPSRSSRGGSLSRSSQSSPWGSTLSLGSSGSLSRSQLSLGSSPSSKPTDLLSVLTHILGHSVSRGNGHSEFVCGKCACVLERVFKFDSVICRVRALSSERLNKLTQERDKVRQWVRQNYRSVSLSSSSEPPCSADEEDGEADREGYREMLRDNMSLSEYECWSERWDTCPYFIRTGKRCRKGKGCEGCDALRVSDSAYESVCGVPRHLPFQPFSPLSRDKSQSMPLHWTPSLGSSPASLAGSNLSLQASSRTVSVQSLDSLDDHEASGRDCCDRPVSLALKELRGIRGRAVRSPSGSRIPVIIRGNGTKQARDEGMTSVSRTLSFGENGVDETDGEDGDVLMELRDEFVPINREIPSAIRTLRVQLHQSLSRVRTLEEELKERRSQAADINGSQDWTTSVLDQSSGFILHCVNSSLHSRERLIQECLSVLGSEGGRSHDLIDKLDQLVKDIQSEHKVAMESVKSVASEQETAMESELESVRAAGRERQKDLDTLNMVLQCNQDIITDLRVALSEKAHQLEEVQKEQEVWRQRDAAMTALLQEKEAQQRLLQERLEAAGGGATHAASQQKRESAALCQEVVKLTAALQDYQQVVTAQQERHSRAVADLTNQLQDARRELREKEAQRKETQRKEEQHREEQRREKAKLRDSVHTRDLLIQQILHDSERRDVLFTELQQNLHNKPETVTAVKHTL